MRYMHDLLSHLETFDPTKSNKNLLNIRGVEWEERRQMHIPMQVQPEARWQMWLDVHNHYAVHLDIFHMVQTTQSIFG